MLPLASPVRQLPADGHEMVVRFAPGATGIGLDHETAGPAVVVGACDAVCSWSSSPAVEPEGDELHAAATKGRRDERGDRHSESERGATQAHYSAGPGGRSPPVPGGRDHVSSTISVLVPVTRPRRRSCSIT